MFALYLTDFLCLHFTRVRNVPMVNAYANSVNLKNDVSNLVEISGLDTIRFITLIKTL